MKEKLKKECPECGSEDVLYDREKDQVVCQSCGTIFEELGSEEDEEAFEEVVEEDVPSHRKKK
ncbi:hypothetical protein KY308_04515 [Candidatus Woesearchaeota archaeon]|nr:hypothetical protein [Candidatus Woesearchaeota archaeon]